MIRRAPAFLQALGRAGFPSHIVVAGERFDFCHAFKHDFFAATALYQHDHQRVVLKLGRQASVLGFPVAWVGRFLCAREARGLRWAAGLPGVPRLVECWGDNGLVREYVDGTPLRRGIVVPDDFFERLRRLVLAIHGRGMAYVDLEKPENVLVGLDGCPYLIDFQIAWVWPFRRGATSRAARWLLTRLQRGDLYHVGKLHRRIRPDQLSAEEMALTYEVPLGVQFHRRFIRPLTRVRRQFLEWVDPRRGAGERGAQEPPGSSKE